MSEKKETKVITKIIREGKYHLYKICKIFLCLFAIALTISGCGISKGEVEANVMSFMQKDFDTNELYKKFRIKVKDINLVKDGDKSYEGLATIEQEGKTYTVPVQAKVDKDKILWRMNSNALDFIAEARKESAIKNFQTELVNDLIRQYNFAVRNGADTFDICMRASAVAEQFLTMGQDSKYAEWNAVKQTDCSRTGLR